MPGGWTFCARPKLLSVAALLLVLVPIVGDRAPARAAETKLGFDTFFDLYVDQPRRHVFVSGGSGTNGVAVFGFDGRLIKRLPDLPGAADLLADETLMYVSLSNANALAVVDLKTLKTVDSIDLSPYAQPSYLSKSGDTIYFSYDCGSHEGSFGSVDLTTRVPVSHDNPIPGSCPEHTVLPSDPNTMFVWDSEGMSTLRRFNVTARRPVQVNQSPDGYLDDIQFSADGETFYARRTLYYSEGTGIDQRRISDFGVVRNYPEPGASYSVTPDERYVVSGGAYGYDDLVVYRHGDAAPATTMSLDDHEYYNEESIMPEAMGTSPSGDRIFAVVSNSDYYSYDASLSFRVIWPQYRVASGPGDQSTPAGGGGFEVWSAATRRARLSPLIGREGRDTFRISPRGTSGYSGGIQGTKLVYQVVRGRQSDLRMYDLQKRRQVSTLGRINTRAWEWHPTMSQGRVLFGRNQGNRALVILRSLTGSRARVLANVSRRSAFAAPGQVNGDFAVWTVCGRVCETYRLNLKTGGRVKMPGPVRRSNYAASVTRAGVVYYAQSGNRCGSKVAIYRWQAGRVTQIEDLPFDDDVFYTYVDDRAGRVLFDRVHCSRKSWDVLEFHDSATAGDSNGSRAEKPDEEEPVGVPPGGGDPWFEDLAPGAS